MTVSPRHDRSPRKLVHPHTCLREKGRKGERKGEKGKKKEKGGKEGRKDEKKKGRKEESRLVEVRLG